MSRDLLLFRLEGDARITLRPSGTEPKNKIYVEVCGAPLGKGASRAALEAEKRRLDEAAAELARGFTRAMLERIGVSLPDHALRISDLVALEHKQEFAERLLPELVARLEAGERGPALEAWLDGRLKPFGADGRLLVAPAIRAFIDATRPRGEVAQWLEGAFGLRK